MYSSGFFLYGLSRYCEEPLHLLVRSPFKGNPSEWLINEKVKLKKVIMVIICVLFNVTHLYLRFVSGVMGFQSF